MCHIFLTSRRGLVDVNDIGEKPVFSPDELYRNRRLGLSVKAISKKLGIDKSKEEALVLERRVNIACLWCHLTYACYTIDVHACWQNGWLRSQTLLQKICMIWWPRFLVVKSNTFHCKTRLISLSTDVSSTCDGILHKAEHFFTSWLWTNTFHEKSDWTNDWVMTRGCTSLN